MLDYRLENRSKNFQKSSAIIPISLRREKVNLSLRKEKLFNFIMDKRIGQVHNDNENEKKQNQNLFIGITNECANISDEDRINFEKKDTKNRIIQLKEWLKINDDTEIYSFKRFAILQLRKLFENSIVISYKSTIIDEGFISLLMREILFTKFLDFRYEYSIIFTKLTYHFEKIPLIDENFIDDLLKLSYYNPIPIIENIIIIIGNLLMDYKHMIINNTNFIKRLRELLFDKDFLDYKFKSKVKINHPINVNIPIITLWSLNTLFENEPNEFLNSYIDIVPDLCKLLTKESIKKLCHEKSEDEINQLLKLLLTLSNTDEIGKELINNNVIDNLIRILQFVNYSSQEDSCFVYDELIFLSTQNLLLCLRILNNIFAMENQYLSGLSKYSDELVRIFENIILRFKIFHKDHIQVNKEIVWTLSNLVTSTTETVDKVCLSNIPNYLLLYFSKSDEVIEQILIFFHNALESCSKLGTIGLMNTKFLTLLCSSIKSFNSKEILDVCLGCLKMIFLFTINLDEEVSYSNCLSNNRPSSSIIEEIEKNSIKSRLESLAIHNNEKISKSSMKLLEFLEKISDPDKMTDNIIQIY